MGIAALSSTSALLPVGGQWLIDVQARDLDGYADVAAPTATVTPPAGGVALPAVEAVGTGRYRATYTVDAPGRYIAQVATGGDAVYFAAYVTATTTTTGMPTTDDVADYLREGAASWDTADLTDALDAEAAAQRATCRVGAVYPDDLRQALLRRVQRNLAMRQLPLAVMQGDAELGPTMAPGRDPEVRRLEAPHRRLAVG
ncbi:hypothetical protein AB0H57_24550 [Micromonospora sp. NPDC050686]|uniref:hypothetical protein n=1 Tax=Micromonospora sp. NPDC050686 TaxID=3154631 RepID=UPI0033E74C5E